MSVTVYRGSYPTRIESTFSFTEEAQARFGFRYGVRTNDGAVLGVKPAHNRTDANGRGFLHDMPRCGDDTASDTFKAAYQAAWLYQSDKRRAAMPGLSPSERYWSFEAVARNDAGETREMKPSDLRDTGAALEAARAGVVTADAALRLAEEPAEYDAAEQALSDALDTRDAALDAHSVRYQRAELRRIETLFDPSCATARERYTIGRRAERCDAACDMSEPERAPREIGSEVTRVIIFGRDPENGARCVEDILELGVGASEAVQIVKRWRGRFADYRVERGFVAAGGSTFFPWEAAKARRVQAAQALNAGELIEHASAAGLAVFTFDEGDTEPQPANAAAVESWRAGVGAEVAAAWEACGTTFTNEQAAKLYAERLGEPGAVRPIKSLPPEAVAPYGVVRLVRAGENGEPAERFTLEPAGEQMGALLWLLKTEAGETVDGYAGGRENVLHALTGQGYDIASGTVWLVRGRNVDGTGFLERGGFISGPNATAYATRYASAEIARWAADHAAKEQSGDPDSGRVYGLEPVTFDAATLAAKRTAADIEQVDAWDADEATCVATGGHYAYEPDEPGEFVCSMCGCACERDGRPIALYGVAVKLVGDPPASAGETWESGFVTRAKAEERAASGYTGAGSMARVVRFTSREASADSRPMGEWHTFEAEALKPPVFEFSETRHRYESARDAIDAVSAFEASTLEEWEYEVTCVGELAWVATAKRLDPLAPSARGYVRPVSGSYVRD